MFTALVDEFGSQFDSNVEQQCFHDIVQYMTNQGGAAAYGHNNIESWFYWCGSRKRPFCWGWAHILREAVTGWGYRQLVQ